MSTTIRNAGTHDLPAIVEIYNASIPARLSTADTEPVSAASRAAWFGDHSPDLRPLWVAEENGEIQGWLSFQSFYGRPAYHATAEVSIYVAPKHQRRGVASRLLEQAIQVCPKLGLSTLVGFIFGHNEPSLQLFKGAGFQQWGYLPEVAELDGRLRDLVILGLRIGPAQTSSRNR